MHRGPVALVPFCAIFRLPICLRCRLLGTRWAGSPSFQAGGGIGKRRHVSRDLGGGPNARCGLDGVAVLQCADLMAAERRIMSAILVATSPLVMPGLVPGIH